MNRWLDWWEQAQRDLRHAENALEDRDFEWSAFAAQQAAEKASKALILSLSGEPWGHSVTALLESLPEPASSSAVEAANRLDKHYLPSRYPNGLPAGFPGKLYTRKEAEDAIVDAREVLVLCGSRLPEPRSPDR